MNALSVLSGTVVATVVAALINSVLLFVGKPLVGTPENFGPLFLMPVLIATVVGCISAGAVFALTRRLSAHPDTTFTMVAFVLLILSFVPDLFLKQATTGPFAGATWAAVVLLMLMHVVVAGSALYVFLHMVEPARA